MSAVAVSGAQKTRTVVEEHARCERRAQPVAARHVVNRLACVHERVGGLQWRERARDDFVLPWRGLRVVHLHLNPRLTELFHDLLKDLCLLTSCRKRVRGAPPVCVRSRDGQRFREQDELSLEADKKFNAGGVLSMSGWSSNRHECMSLKKTK